MMPEQLRGHVYINIKSESDGFISYQICHDYTGTPIEFHASLESAKSSCSYYGVARPEVYRSGERIE